MEKKRKQRPYSEYERTLLMQLVQPKVDILESRKIDSISIRNKAEVWEQISSEFNASPNITQTADAKQLRKMWQNIKTKARAVKSLEAQRKNSANIPTLEVGSLESQVLSILPNLKAGGITLDSEIINYEKNEDDEMYWQPKRRRRGSDTEHNYSQEPRDLILQELDTRLEEDHTDNITNETENLQLPNLCDNTKYTLEDIKKQILLQELFNNKVRFDREMKYRTRKNEIEFKHIHEKHQLELEILEIKKMLLIKDLNSK